jgi:hypothetical protein
MKISQKWLFIFIALGILAGLVIVRESVASFYREGAYYKGRYY